MNKKTKFKLNETLDKALQPPKKKSQDGLSALLSQYTEDAPKPPETLPTLTSQTRHTRQTSQTAEIAPVKNFSKVANSISKQAVPDGWFKGKSKQLYDTLYSLTRGSINPSRTVRIQKTKLMKLSAIGARNTFDSNIHHLKTIGLINEVVFIGEHEGNQFEVFLPEEISLPSVTSQSSYSSQTSHAQKLDRLVTLETSQTSQSLSRMGSNNYEHPNTFLKTLNQDDEAYRQFIDKLDEAAKEITGKKLSTREADGLGKLADLLILELRIAARRTESISSIPAFLTEVLRRKLRDTPTAKSLKVKIDKVGKPESETYEIKSLDEEGREAALEQLREWAGDDLLQDFKKWYTPEDWTWLTKELEVDQS